MDLALVGIIVAIFFGVIGVLLTIGGFIFSHHRRAMEQPESREDYIRRLNHPVYFQLLESCLGWMDDFFGPQMSLRPFRFEWRGFFVCEAISLGYAYASFVIGWMMGAPGALGRVSMFSDSAPLAGCRTGFAG
ncbi:MAG: hypothetical protein HOC91_08985 [Nitrospinaceae bacterium]|nr:hypothetical protein [Nitrospinaceae bacterium]MBT3434289.1 hypothetical protein [Nitrospinaceae bacterium]MBT3821638.1 hypothetical protein [Nitrospinaceae bacterium]MBT4093748.1 hypothetical protein [Nitrospinaceae bacterium]MBT4430633.1 hypothetical protein [Nitrospinaceae bacterium]